MRFKYLVLFLLGPLWLWSQNSKKQEPVTPYQLPDFSPGVLFYTNQTTQNVYLNYHKATEQIVLDHASTKLPIEDITNLDSVKIGGHIFIKSDDRWLEQLLSPPNQLLVRHRATVQLESKEGAFGTKSQSTNIDRVLLGDQVAGNYDLRWSDEYRFISHTETWFVKDGVLQKANGVGQIGSIFPEIKKEIKKFVSSEKIDFDDVMDIKKVIMFCRGQE